MRRRLLGVVLGLLTVFSPSLGGETCDLTEMSDKARDALTKRMTGNGHCPPGSSGARAAFGAVPVFRPEEVEALRCLLKELPHRCTMLEEECEQPWPPKSEDDKPRRSKEPGAGERLVNFLYGDICNPAFPDFIVYVPKAYVRKDPKEPKDRRDVTDLRPTLLWRNESRRYIYGAQHVWILVFTEEDPTKLSLEGRLTTIYSRPPNPLVHLFGALGKSAAVLSEGEKAEEKTQKLEFQWTSLTADKKPIFLGNARAAVAIDSVNRISIFSGAAQVPTDGGRKVLTLAKDGKLELVACPECRDKPGDQPAAPMDALSLHGVFSNSRASYGGISIAAGGTWNAGGSSFGDDDVHANAYVLGKFYPGRPLRPTLKVPVHGGGLAYRPSLGIVFGTNVNGDAFKELVYGVSVGHLLGKTGVVLGVTSIESGKADPAGPEIARKSRPFFAFEYTF